MKHTFLIYISYSYAVPTGIPLEKEILKRGHDVRWFCDIPNERKYIPKSFKVLNTIQEVIQYQPQVVLTITDIVPDFIPGLKVQVFHGFDPEKRSFKKGHCRIRGFFDLYCTQGPSTTSIFKMHQRKKPHFEAIETGWSKVDPLFPITKTSNNELPTIFIASTFSKKLSLAYNEEVYEKIKQISKLKKYHFLMVLHPKLPEEIKTKWKQLQNVFFTYHDTTDLIPLQKKADIMFSDTTSAIQEFGLQEKPIVTFNHFVAKPYLINITDTNDIEDALEKALSYPREILEKLADFNNQLHPYKDGESSKRVIETCIDFLYKDKSYLSKKPLNLIRKYKIRKHLNFFTFKSYRKPFTIKNTQ